MILSKKETLSERILECQLNNDDELDERTKLKDMDTYKFVRLRRTTLTRGGVRGGVKPKDH